MEKYKFYYPRTSRIYRLDAKQQQLTNARPLPDVALQRIKENMTIEWTYNSNSIEGNTLTLQETKMVLEDGMTVGVNRFENILKQ